MLLGKRMALGCVCIATVPLQSKEITFCLTQSVYVGDTSNDTANYACVAICASERTMQIAERAIRPAITKKIAERARRGHKKTKASKA